MNAHTKAEMTYKFGTQFLPKPKFDGWRLMPANTVLTNDMVIVFYNFKGKDPTFGNPQATLPRELVADNCLRMTDRWGMGTVAQYGIYKRGNDNDLDFVSKEPPMPLNSFHSEAIPLP